ncbi:CxC2 domain-containing protein [Mycena indigotica]|uniref:CxC2 domain-containing protein n=1 Tax=Mycena indigotica TaxID=2126181 RepID=A0A8H6SFG1_9AGAR|nr:CxC2 domain-containing protein [Mycena indigotica]KAF7297387.1 CxC2 domain-containing protein [Mycena indigotica]
MWCDDCCVKSHIATPFHSIELWNAGYFQSCSLKVLGLVIQVGHPLHLPCARPIPARNDFVVLHHNGIHEVSVNYCGCRWSNDPYHIQLLRAGIYPATTDSPRTGATFECLAEYHALTLHGRLPGGTFIVLWKLGQTRSESSLQTAIRSFFESLANTDIYCHSNEVDVDTTPGAWRIQHQGNSRFFALHARVQA